MRKTGHIRERSPGSFELRYALGINPATGQRKIATATFHGNRRDADKELRRRLREVDENIHADAGGTTLAAWLDRWLRLIAPEVSGRTVERYGELCAGFIKPRLGALALDRVDAAAIQGMLSDLAVTGRRDRKPGGLSATS